MGQYKKVKTIDGVTYQIKKIKALKDKLRYTPADVEKIVGLTPGDLYYYESLGLVSSFRNEKNYRYFSREQVEEIKKLYQKKYVQNEK